MEFCTPKRVLFVIGTLQAGGAERQMVLLIDGLIKLGVRCEVFVLDGSGPLRSRLEELRVRVYEARRSRSTARPHILLTIVLGFVRLWLTAMRTRPHVLQAYLPLTNLMGAVAGRLAGVPVVITCRRGLGTHQDRHTWWRNFDRVANCLSHIVTVNSRAVADDTVARDGISRSKLVMIRNGLDLTSFQAEAAGDNGRQIVRLGQNEIGLVSVANLIPYKGHVDLINAYALSRPSLPRSKLFIVGRDDGIGTELKQLTLDLGISDHVVFLGSSNNVGRVLRAMSLFVLASHEEGSSNALLEAMASGLAIIATDAGGNRELLDDGRFGLLVPARHPVALARAIQTVVSDLKPWRERGLAAAEYVRVAYSAQSLSTNYLALYQSKSACPHRAVKYQSASDDTV